MKCIFRHIIMMCVLIVSLSLTVSAAANTTFNVGSAACSAGESVIIPVSIKNNNGVTGVSLTLEFDTSVLKLIDVSDTGLIPGEFHTSAYTSPYELTWHNDNLETNYTANGVLVNLEFIVSDTAECRTYDIVISSQTDGILDCDGNVLTCSYNDGSITVEDEQECSHSWGDWAKTSSKQHKRSCKLCGEAEYERHDWNDGEVTEEATEDSTGVLTYTCDICGAIKTETIPALEPDEDEPFTVSGYITSSGSTTDIVTVRLLNSENREIDSTTTASGEYSLSAPAGTYTLEVSKTKHATREYSVTVDSDDITLNAEIWLYGDVYQADGGVTMVDATQIQRYLSGKTSVFGSTTDTDLEAYRLKVADIYTDDGGVSMVDATQIQRYLSGKSSIFNTLP